MQVNVKELTGVLHLNLVFMIVLGSITINFNKK